MNLRTTKTQFNLRWILIAAFSLILLGEAYVAYTYLYSNIFGTEIEAPPGNVVRVNLKAYEDTVDYVNTLYDYKPEVLSLPRSNPFR